MRRGPSGVGGPESATHAAPPEWLGVVVNSRITGYVAAACTITAKSVAVATFSLVSPVGSLKWVRSMPSDWGTSGSCEPEPNASAASFACHIGPDEVLRGTLVLE